MPKRIMVLFLLLTLIALSTAAQEESTSQEPVVTVEPTVTAVPTDLPTATPEPPLPPPTELPTEVATEVPPPTVEASPTLDPAPTQTPSEESTPSVDVTETPQPEATAQVTPVVLPLPLLYAANFETGVPNELTAEGVWQSVQTDDGFALQPSGAGKLVFTPLMLLDVEIELDVLLNAGTVTLSREVDGLGYALTLDDTGRLALIKNGELVNTALLTLKPGQWVTLRLSLRGGDLVALVDGVSVIVASDALPLGAGLVQVTVSETTLARVDDLAIYSDAELPILITPEAPIRPTQEGTNQATPQVLNPIACPDASANIAMASVSSAGVQGQGFFDGYSNVTVGYESPRMSDNGRYVVFQSYSDNLVSGDTNGIADIFRYDRITCTTIRVSVNNFGEEYPGSYWYGYDVSDDGNLIAFSDYVAVYIRDVTNGTTTQFNNSGFGVTLSGNGEYVAFSTAASLVPEDDNTTNDIYRLRLADSTYTLVSVSSSGDPEYSSAHLAFDAAISDDGSKVTWVSNGLYGLSLNNYTCEFDYDEPYDFDEKCYDVFWRDITNGITKVVSVDNNGNPGTTNAGSLGYGAPSLSGNGRYVVFMTASSLAALDTDNQEDVYVHDTTQNTTQLASLNHLGQNTTGYVAARSGSISDDGTRVAMEAFNYTAQFVPTSQIYVRNIATGQNVLVSVNSSNQPGSGGGTGAASISGDGTRVAFISSNTNLVAGDTESSCETDYQDPFDNDENCNDVFVAAVPAFPPPPAALPAPSALSFTATTNSVTLTFTDNSSDETNFRVERFINQVGWISWQEVGTVTAAGGTGSTRSFTQTNVPCGAGLVYRVRAFRASDNTFSAYTSTLNVQIPRCAPVACDPGQPIARASVGPLGTSQPDVSSDFSFFPLSAPRVSTDGRYAYFQLFNGSSLLESGNPSFYRYDRLTCDTEDGSGDFPRADVLGILEVTSTTAVNDLIDNNTFCGQFGFGSGSFQCPDVYLRNTTTNEFTLISRNYEGTASANGSSNNPRMLELNGKLYVLFSSNADDLIDSDTTTGCTGNRTECFDTYLYNVTDDIMTLISTRPDGTQAASTVGQNGLTGFHIIPNAAGDTFYVTMLGAPNSLVPGITGAQIYLRTLPVSALTGGRLVGGSVELISRANGAAGAAGNNSSFAPFVSQDGRYVSFTSNATNLVTGDTNGTNDVFVRDTVLQETRLVSRNASNQIANGGSNNVGISANGISIVFNSAATNLVPGDTNFVCHNGNFSTPQFISNCVDTFIARNPFFAPLTNPTVTASTNQAGQITLTLSGLGSADEYRIERRLNPSDTFSQIAVVSASPYVDSPYFCGTSRQYRIRTYRASDDTFSAYSAIVTGSTPACTTVTAPVLTAPATGSFTNNTTPTLAWNAVANSSSYEVQLSTVASFSSFVDGYPVTGLNVTTHTPAAPLPDGLYFWRVRAYNTAETPAPGAFSAARTFTVDTFGIFDVTTLNTPTEGAALTSVRPAIAYTAVPGAARYKVQFATDIDFTQNVRTFGDVAPFITGTSFTVPVAAPAFDFGTWYVRVVAVDAAGNDDTVLEASLWSNPRRFIVTPGIPPAPTFSASAVPANGALVSANQPLGLQPNGINFLWSPVVAANQTFVYELQANLNDAAFATVLEFGDTTSDPFLNAVDLSALADGIVSWRVRAINQYGVAGPFSVVRNFALDRTPPATPAFNLPAADAILSQARPAFTWAAVPTATRYILTVGGQTYGETAPFITGTSFALPATAAPLTQGEHTATLVAVDAAGNQSSEASRTFSVFIGNAPAVNTVINSAAARPTFTWTAVAGTTQYELQIDRDGDGNFATGSVYTSEPRTGTSFNTATSPGFVSLTPGVYYWRVIRVGETVANTFGRKLIILPTPTAPAIIAQPFAPDAILSAADLASANVAWSPVTAPAGVDVKYEVQVGRASSFPDATTVTFAGNPSTEQSLASVDDIDGTKFVRVRAVFTVNGESIAGPYSAVRSYVLDRVPPPVPTLNLPITDSTVSQARPTFSWTASPGTSYQLVVDNNIYNNVPVTAASFTGTPTGANAVAPLAQGAHEVKLVARDAAGNEVETALRSFNIFIGTAPAAGQVFATGNIPFAWTAVAGATSYALQIDDDPNFGSTVPLTPATVTGTSRSIPVSSLPTGLYFWRVQPSTEGALTIPGRAFYVNNVLLNAPVIQSIEEVAAGTVVTNDTTPEAVFTTINPASLDTLDRQIEVQISTTSTFAVVVRSLRTEAGSLALEDVNWLDALPATAGQPYFMRARAVYGSGDATVAGPFSAARAFTLDTVSPAAPVLVAPAEGGMIVTPRPAFRWNAAAGANRYQLDVSSDGFVTTLPDYTSRPVTATSFTGAATGATAVAALPTGLYQWRVRALDAAGNISDNSVVGVFFVNNVTLTAPSLASVQNVASGTVITNDTTPEALINPGLTPATLDTAVRSYEVQISTTSNFATITRSLVNADELLEDGDWGDPLPATASQSYFIRVRATYVFPLGTVNSPFSAARAFTLDIVPPDAPVLVAPAAGSLITTPRPAFRWNAAAGANRYQLDVSSDGFVTTLPDYTSRLVTATSFTGAATGANAVAVLPTGLYQWRVRALDAAGNVSANSIFGVFFVNNVTLTAPNLASVQNVTSGTVITNDTTPEALINPATTPATLGSASRAFEVQISTTSSFAVVVRTVTSTDAELTDDDWANSSASPLPDTAGQAYFLRVRAIYPTANGTILSTFSAARPFTLDTVAPAAPILLTPVDSALFVTNGAIQFRWNPVPTAVRYLFTYDLEPTSGTPFTPTTTATTLTPLSSWTNETYQWFVRAQDAAGNLSEPSAVRVFTVSGP